MLVLLFKHDTRSNLALTFAGNKRDEFAHALLHAFFGLFCDFRIFWKRQLHYTRNLTQKLAYPSTNTKKKKKRSRLLSRKMKGMVGLEKRGGRLVVA